MTQQNDDPVVVDPEIDPQEAQGTDPAPSATQAATETPPADEEHEGIEITIGDEPAPTPAADAEPTGNAAPTWVRDLRKSNREKDRKLREQEAEIARLKGAQATPTATVVGDEPTLEGCDYDGDKFKSELLAWTERKAKVDREARERANAAEKQNLAWNERLSAYDTAKKALKVDDYEDAEEGVRGVLSPLQQSILIGGADRAELLVYALGKNPKKLQELAEISDPVKFTFALAKLETQLKVTPKKSAPAPERIVRGGGATAGVVDNQLERLRADALKNGGDMSKVIAYKNAQRAKQRA